jgi:hypothetical protein
MSCRDIGSQTRQPMTFDPFGYWSAEEATARMAIEMTGVRK